MEINSWKYLHSSIDIAEEKEKKRIRHFTWKYGWVANGKRHCQNGKGSLANIVSESVYANGWRNERWFRRLSLSIWSKNPHRFVEQVVFGNWTFLVCICHVINWQGAGKISKTTTTKHSLWFWTRGKRKNR